MLSYRTALCSLILLVVGLSLVSCGGSDFRKTEAYYLVATNVDLPYWQAARAGLLRAAAEVGVVADMVGPDTYSPAGELEAFQELVNLETPPAGILVSPSDPVMMTPANRAAEQSVANMASRFSLASLFLLRKVRSPKKTPT